MVNCAPFCKLRKGRFGLLLGGSRMRTAPIHVAHDVCVELIGHYNAHVAWPVRLVLEGSLDTASGRFRRALRDAIERDGPAQIHVWGHKLTLGEDPRVVETWVDSVAGRVEQLLDVE